uniref:Uncharacterized protein n=1 Tax=Octopus bimaculoides TaxID=37653 RepID=A0A0L8FHT6_OCTBM
MGFGRVCRTALAKLSIYRLSAPLYDHTFIHSPTHMPIHMIIQKIQTNKTRKKNPPWKNNICLQNVQIAARKHLLIRTVCTIHRVTKLLSEM